MHYLRAHARITSAFIMREISTRYGRSPGGYLWAFIEPIAFIAIMAGLMGSLGRMPPLGESFVLFYATGFLGFTMYRGMESYLSSAISANRALLSYPIVAPIDAIFGRLILQGATSSIVSFLVISASLHLLRHQVIVNWAPVIEAVACAWLLALGVSLLSIVIFFYLPLAQKIYDILTRPLLLVSGIFYLPSSMPHPMREVLLANPISHIIMLFRTGFYGSAGSNGLDVAYLAKWVGLILAIGMFAFSITDVARAREK